jgi:nitroreductase
MNLSTPDNLAIVAHLLTTTRTVRKRLDLERSVEPEIIRECLDIAIQAPTGSNAQGWHFVVVTDESKRSEIGALYRKSFEIYRPPSSREKAVAPSADPQVAQMARVIDSATYLSENMYRAPVLIIPCVNGRPDDPSPHSQAGFYGSILPAAWSLMLALRARGLGCAWTTLHLRYEQEVARILSIPDDITQAALLPVAYFTGEDFKPAKRVPAAERTYWNGWK